MKIATKTLLALLNVTALSLRSLPSLTPTRNLARHLQRQVQRIQQHHDRKFIVRSSVLGMTPDALKQELKTRSFEKILKDHGFITKEGFWIALHGKIKDELKKRGLSEEKISYRLLKRRQLV